MKKNTHTHADVSPQYTFSLPPHFASSNIFNQATEEERNKEKKKKKKNRHVAHHPTHSTADPNEPRKPFSTS